MSNRGREDGSEKPGLPSYVLSHIFYSSTVGVHRGPLEAVYIHTECCGGQPRLENMRVGKARNVPKIVIYSPVRLLPFTPGSL